MKLELKCKEHPKYKAKHHPRVYCPTCEWLWQVANDPYWILNLSVKRI